MQSVSVPSNYTLELSDKLHNSGLAMTLPLVGSPYICNNKDRRPYLHQHVFDQFNTVTELALNFELHISIEVLALGFHIFCFQNTPRWSQSASTANICCIWYSADDDYIVKVQ